MGYVPRSRRQFLAGAGSSLAAAWVAANWPAIAAAHTHAIAAAADPGTPALGFLQPEDARLVDAIAARIIPTDETPGAREAGALYFIDRSLQTWAAWAAEPFRTGLREFRAGFVAAHPEVDFAVADAVTQIGYLTQVEKTDFFGTMRFLTLVGMFVLPSYGGNRDSIGWRLIGFDDAHAFTPPFGYYDRDYPGFVLPKDAT
jgi:gluconate 2-dehydrogenase gamma chain